VYHHALVLPLLVDPGRAGIAIVLFVVVARSILFRSMADEAVRMELVEVILKLGADHVVGRSDDVGQRTDTTKVVTNSRKA